MPTIRIHVTIPPDKLKAWWYQLLGPGFKPATPPTRPAQYSKANFSLPDGCPDVPESNPPKKYVEITPIPNTEGMFNLVLNGRCDLQFSFPDEAEGEPNYAGFRPVGISFYKDAALDSYKTGMGSVRFGEEPMLPGQKFGVPYVIVKSRATKSKGEKYKYMIMIQDCLGNIGIIDPEIENDINPS
jgi:hypothetical protein